MALDGFFRSRGGPVKLGTERRIRAAGYAATKTWHTLSAGLPSLAAPVDHGWPAPGEVFMRSRFASRLAIWGAIGALGLAAPAAIADTSDGPLRKDFPKPSDNPALEKWRDGLAWRYSTDYLFGVTRGLKDQEIPLWCERAAWVVTVPFDIANLPFTALAGLFGD